MIDFQNKKRQVTYIAPLQPPTLAAFLPWGSSAGAGRIRLARAKISQNPEFPIKDFLRVQLVAAGRLTRLKGLIRPHLANQVLRVKFVKNWYSYDSHSYQTEAI